MNDEVAKVIESMSDDEKESFIDGIEFSVDYSLEISPLNMSIYHALTDR